MSNCSDFLLLKEDHTLGNLLSVYLKMAPHVMMAAYKSNPISTSTHIELVPFPC